MEARGQKRVQDAVLEALRLGELSIDHVDAIRKSDGKRVRIERGAEGELETAMEESSSSGEGSEDGGSEEMEEAYDIPIDGLPLDVWLDLIEARRITYTDIITLSLANQRIMELLQAPEVWKSLFAIDFPAEYAAITTPEAGEKTWETLMAGAAEFGIAEGIPTISTEDIDTVRSLGMNAVVYTNLLGFVQKPKAGPDRAWKWAFEWATRRKFALVKTFSKSIGTKYAYDPKVSYSIAVPGREEEEGEPPRLITVRRGHHAVRVWSYDLYAGFKDVPGIPFVIPLPPELGDSPEISVTGEVLIVKKPVSVTEARGLPPPSYVIYLRPGGAWEAQLFEPNSPFEPTWTDGIHILYTRRAPRAHDLRNTMHVFGGPMGRDIDTLEQGRFFITPAGNVVERPAVPVQAGRTFVAGSVPDYLAYIEDVVVGAGPNLVVLTPSVRRHIGMETVIGSVLVRHVDVGADASALTTYVLSPTTFLHLVGYDSDTKTAAQVRVDAHRVDGGGPPTTLVLNKDFVATPYVSVSRRPGLGRSFWILIMGTDRLTGLPRRNIYATEDPTLYPDPFDVSRLVATHEDIVGAELPHILSSTHIRQ